MKTILFTTTVSYLSRAASPTTSQKEIAFSMHLSELGVSPDDIHLFVAGGEAGRFSAFLPGWGHMTSHVLRAIDGQPPASGPLCIDGTCLL